MRWDHAQSQIVGSDGARALSRNEFDVMLGEMLATAVTSFFQMPSAQT